MVGIIAILSVGVLKTDYFSRNPFVPTTEEKSAIKQAEEAKEMVEKQGGLPPDPGEAGKVALEGIDSDGDGVRDDIERYIALTYPNSEKTRAAATQNAKAIQALVLDSSDKEASIRNAQEESDALDCLSYIHGMGTNTTRTIASELLAQMLNTDARSRAYLTADEHLGGQHYPSTPLAERKLRCDFDPDAMGN